MDSKSIWQMLLGAGAGFPGAAAGGVFGSLLNGGAGGAGGDAGAGGDPGGGQAPADPMAPPVAARDGLGGGLDLGQMPQGGGGSPMDRFLGDRISGVIGHHDDGGDQSGGGALPLAEEIRRRLEAQRRADEAEGAGDGLQFHANRKRLMTYRQRW